MSIDTVNISLRDHQNVMTRFLNPSEVRSERLNIQET